MKITHYYAGYRIDDVPERTENRDIEPGCNTAVSKFIALLHSEGLFGDFVFRFAARHPGKKLKDYFNETPMHLWLITSISWVDKVYEYFFITIKWEDLCKSGGISGTS